MRKAPLTLESVLDGARRATGMSDFGEPAFLGPLDRLLSELDASTEGVVKTLYAWFDLPLSTEAVSRMNVFVVKDRREKRGHTYCPEDFGLTRVEIQEQFQEYTIKHGVPQEN